MVRELEHRALTHSSLHRRHTASREGCPTKETSPRPALELKGTQHPLLPGPHKEVS